MIKGIVFTYQFEPIFLNFMAFWLIFTSFLCLLFTILKEIHNISLFFYCICRGKGLAHKTITRQILILIRLSALVALRLLLWSALFLMCRAIFVEDRILLQLSQGLVLGLFFINSTINLCYSTLLKVLECNPKKIFLIFNLLQLFVVNFFLK